MTKPEWDQMEDDLEPIIKQVGKICRRHGLAQLSVAVFGDADGPDFALGSTGDPGAKDTDYYELDVYHDDHTSHSLNAKTYYTKS